MKTTTILMKCMTNAFKQEVHVPFNYLLLIIVAIILKSVSANAQSVELGNVVAFRAQLERYAEQNYTHAFTLSEAAYFNFELKPEEYYASTERLEVVGLASDRSGIAGSFNIIIFEDNSIEGSVVFEETKVAFEIVATSKGHVLLRSISIDNVICVLPATETVQDNEIVHYKKTYNSKEALSLQSYPDAKGCIYLDFDGEVSGTKNAGPAGLTDEQIYEVWSYVSEDYAPFDLNVTTDRNVFDGYPNKLKQLCVITATDVSPGNYGVATYFSFSSSSLKVAWIMVKGRGSKSVASTITHEVGHTLGLSHDQKSLNNIDRSNYYGHGSWASVLARSVSSKPIVQWNKGEYKDAYNKSFSSLSDYTFINDDGNQVQDDLGIITSPRNGFGYRSDDHGNTPQTATNIYVQSNGVIYPALADTGIIEKNTDSDYFKFTTTGENVNISVNPSIWKPNLDIGVTLFKETNGSIQEVDKFNPENSNPKGEPYLAATINRYLEAGTYYLKIYGVGAHDPYLNGYSDYGSLGPYKISFNPSDYIAEIFSYCCHRHGKVFGIGLNEGVYSLADLVSLGATGNELSSFKIKSGYEIFLFEKNDLTGEVHVFSSNVNYLNNIDPELNNFANSIIIRKASNLNVEITAPISNSIYSSSVLLEATANTNVGDIKKVSFFIDDQKIGDVTAAINGIYQLSWTPPSSGDYEVKAVVEEESRKTVTSEPVLFTVSNVTSVNEVEGSLSVALTNPIKDKMQIMGTDMQAQSVDELILYNSLGKTVRQFYDLPSGDYVDVSDLSSGVYFVRIRIEGKEKILRIIKE